MRFKNGRDALGSLKTLITIIWLLFLWAVLIVGCRCVALCSPGQGGF